MRRDAQLLLFIKAAAAAEEIDSPFNTSGRQGRDDDWNHRAITNNEGSKGHNEIAFWKEQSPGILE